MGVGALVSNARNYQMSQHPMTVKSRYGSDGSLTIKFREYIADVVAPADGSDVFRTYYINPALAFNALYQKTTGTNSADLSGGTGLFSWLPNVANSFQQYRIEDLNVEYITTSGAVTSSQALGTVLMGIQYDANEIPFLEKATILNSEGGMSGVPSENHYLNYECDKANMTVENLYTIDPNLVPTPPLPPNAAYCCGSGSSGGKGDPRFIFPGIITIATSGTPTASAPVALGQLWVDYEMTLLRPRVPAVKSSPS